MSKKRLLFFTFVAIMLTVTSSLAMAFEEGKDGIGFYSAVAGHVSVTHSGEARVFPVKLHDQVLFKDVIETQNESRTKAFFQDDSILTVGENSRVEINEYIYNPEDNVRRAIVKLMQGQVRALVSKVFKANGSKFEVHTPSAVAAARGTYFAVWANNGESGIINIGEKGRVEFTSGGMTVAVDPGYFSVAKEGEAPSIPMKHELGQVEKGQSGTTMKDGEATVSRVVNARDRSLNSVPSGATAELTQIASSAGLAQALAAVGSTTLREVLIAESPGEALQAMNLDTWLLQTLSSVTRLTTESLNNTAQVNGQVNGTNSTTVLGQVRVDTLEQGNGLASVSVAGTALTASVGSTTVGPVSVGPVAVGPVTIAPTVTVPAVTLPTVTVAVPTVVPVAPVTVGPVTVVPSAPVLAVPVTPPAVINGALNLIKP
jgi:hypothetical protein